MPCHRALLQAWDLGGPCTPAALVRRRIYPLERMNFFPSSALGLGLRGKPTRKAPALAPLFALQLEQPPRIDGICVFLEIWP